MDKNTLWNSASVPGLAVGGVCIAYELLNWACGNITTAALAGVAAALLWVLKFGGGLYLLYFFCKRYVATLDNPDGSDTFRFGVVVSLYSSIFYAAFYLAYTLYIVPDIYKEAFDAIIESGLGMADQSVLDQITELEPSMPAIGCVCKFVYSFLFGLILSAIYSRSIPSRNPFEQIDNEKD